ncbi:MAG TPA: 2-phosphosulfolactate phosphatase [Ktedonobacterales bacterium]|nr:2-phosphosulfolactate phosphatase [Ktedonobacterales bacterium]
MRDEFVGGPLAVDVALVPSLVRTTHPQHAHTVYIVVDVIRATTTLCVLLERGCRQVLVARDIASAREARALSHGDALLAGEVGGAMPAGFDLGNSPGQISGYELRQGSVLFATTNGTRALHACQGGGAIFAGALRNAGAVAVATVRTAQQLAPRRARVAEDVAHMDEAMASEALPVGASDIVVVCSGRDDLPAYDDTVCAGYLVERIVDQIAKSGGVARLASGARIAQAVVRQALAEGSMYDALASSDAARSLEGIGLFSDVTWCADVDATSLVPTVVGDEHGLPVIAPDDD